MRLLQIIFNKYGLYYWKIQFRCCPGVGHLHGIFKPHRGVFVQVWTPRPTVGHLQLFQKKMINTRQLPEGNWRGGGGLCERHARAINLKRGILSSYKDLSRTQTRASIWSVVGFETNFTKLFICFGGKGEEIVPRPVTVKVTDSLRCSQPTV